MWCRCVRARSAWPAPWPCSRPALGWAPGTQLCLAHCLPVAVMSAPVGWAFAGRARSALQFCPASSRLRRALPQCSLRGRLGRVPTPFVCRPGCPSLAVHWPALFTCVALPSVRSRTLAGREPSAQRLFAGARFARRHVGTSLALPILHRCCPAVRTPHVGCLATRGVGVRSFTLSVLCCPVHSASGFSCLTAFFDMRSNAHALVRAPRLGRAARTPPFLLSSFASMRNSLQCMVQCDFAASTLVFALRTRPVHKVRGN